MQLNTMQLSPLNQLKSERSSRSEGIICIWTSDTKQMSKAQDLVDQGILEVVRRRSVKSTNDSYKVFRET